jgi:hypothetical protein
VRRGRAFDPTMPEEAMHLLDGGVPVAEAMARVGWTIEAAHRWATRHHHTRLADRTRPAVAEIVRERRRPHAA